jgi:hypothetical protein
MAQGRTAWVKAAYARVAGARAADDGALDARAADDGAARGGWRLTRALYSAAHWTTATGGSLVWPAAAALALMAGRSAGPPAFAAWPGPCGPGPALRSLARHCGPAW